MRPGSKPHGAFGEIHKLYADDIMGGANMGAGPPTSSEGLPFIVNQRKNSSMVIASLVEEKKEEDDPEDGYQHEYEEEKKDVLDEDEEEY